MLLSFVFKDSQQQYCLLRNMIIECHVRSNLSLPGARANQIAISSFCLLFHFLPAISIDKNSKTTNQSDLRNNAQHVIIILRRGLALLGRMSWRLCLRLACIDQC